VTYIPYEKVVRRRAKLWPRRRSRVAGVVDSRLSTPLASASLDWVPRRPFIVVIVTAVGFCVTPPGV